MKKIITIQGMSCGHCTAKVEKALTKLQDVKSVKVNLKKSIAIVDVNNADTDTNAILKSTVEDLGYIVVGISDKKCLFCK